MGSRLFSYAQRRHAKPADPSSVLQGRPSWVHCWHETGTVRHKQLGSWEGGVPSLREKENTPCSTAPAMSLSKPSHPVTRGVLVLGYHLVRPMRCHGGTHLPWSSMSSTSLEEPKSPSSLSLMSAHPHSLPTVDIRVRVGDIAVLSSVERLCAAFSPCITKAGHGR